MRYLFAVFLAAAAAHVAAAHDTWVQTNTNLVRTGDVVHIDLMLGNHGNDHRDFKLASKVSPESGTLEVVAPDGKRYDLRPNLADLGYAPKEGFWSARFVPGKPGLYTVSHTRDGVAHGSRGIKSGKTYFVVSESLDRVATENPGFEKPLGHALELVPAANPVTPMGCKRSTAASRWPTRECRSFPAAPRWPKGSTKSTNAAPMLAAKRRSRQPKATTT
jgi:hypothetical protein